MIANYASPITHVDLSALEGAIRLLGKR